MAPQPGGRITKSDVKIKKDQNKFNMTSLWRHSKQISPKLEVLTLEYQTLLRKFENYLLPRDFLVKK